MSEEGVRNNLFNVASFISNINRPPIIVKILIGEGDRPPAHPSLRYCARLLGRLGDLEEHISARGKMFGNANFIPAKRTF